MCYPYNWRRERCRRTRTCRSQRRDTPDTPFTPPNSGLTAAAVRSAVRQLFQDQTHREAAQRIKTELDAMPKPASIRPRLVELTAHA